MGLGVGGLGFTPRGLGFKLEVLRVCRLKLLAFGSQDFGAH